MTLARHCRGCDKVIHSGGWCDDCARQRRSSEVGAELTRLVCERDPGCRLQLEGCTQVSTTADHIVPVSAGGETTLENLRGACLHCNSSRGAGVTDEQPRLGKGDRPLSRADVMQAWRDGSALRQQPRRQEPPAGGVGMG